jgi:hypothetical protein
MRTGAPTRHWEWLLEQRVDPDSDSFSWLSTRALLSAFNDVLAQGAETLVDDMRQRWVAAQRASGVATQFPGFVIDRTTLKEPSFLVLGDPGEGDASQYSVVKPLLGKGNGSDFMVICSDVVYPAGDVNGYVNAFYIPYKDYAKPIYALPGNHDWYDGLNGFMYVFCAAEPLPEIPYNRASFSFRVWLARRFWRKALAPKRTRLATYRRLVRSRATVFRERAQPGPYFAIDAGAVLVVAIDTGVGGTIDREQGDWLRDVSTIPKPKILLTGKPLHVDNKRHPCRIDDEEVHDELGRPEKYKFVDEIVRDPRHLYIAAIGGDVHNYQRYQVRLADGRQLASIVSGGGGAYLSNTHRIRREMEEDPNATLVSCYPSRAQSIKLYAGRLVPALWRLLLITSIAVLAAFVTAGVLFAVSDDPGWMPALVVGAFLVGITFIQIATKTTVGAALVEERPVKLWPSLLSAGLLGVAVALAGGWLLGERHGWALLLWGWCVLVLVPATLADRRSKQRGGWLKAGWVGSGLAALLSVLAVVGIEGGWDRWEVGVGALVIVIPAMAFGVPRLFRARPEANEELEPSTIVGVPSRPPAPQKPWAWRGALTYLVFAPLAVVAVVVLAASEPRAVTVVGLALAIVAFMAAMPIVSYLARQRNRVTQWAYVVAFILILPATVSFLAVWLDRPLLIRAPVATLCVLVSSAAAVSLLYLLWLRAISLARPDRWGDRDGELSEQQAEAFASHEYETETSAEEGEGRIPTSGKAYRVARMVTPPGAARSIVHRAISEIFAPTGPPFYTNFLRVECSEMAVKVTAFGITGEADDADQIDEVSLPYPRVSITTTA